MKKRTLFLLLALTTTFTFTACGNTSQSATTGAQNTEITESVNKEVAEVESEIIGIDETEVIESTEINSEIVEDTKDNTEISEVVHIKEEYKSINFDEYPWMETGEDPQYTHYYGVTWKASNGV